MRGFRVGVVNPTTRFGTRVRELLSEQHLPVIELKLFESGIVGEATLTEFAGEVVVTQPLDEDLFPQLDVCFFSGRDVDALNRVATAAAEQDVAAIVEGSVGLDAEVWAPGISEPRGEGRGVVAIPRPASYLAGAVVKRLHDALGVERASATLLLSAGERGEPGAQELAQQTVNILNFKAPPTEVLGEQLAFNVHVAGRGAKAPLLAETVAREAAALAGLEDAMTVSVLRAPFFQGTAASIWVELSKGREQRELEACFQDPPFVLDSARRGGGSPSPVSVAESEHIHVGSIRRPLELARPGAWVWAAAGDDAFDPAAAAVELARSMLGVPES